MRSLEPCMKSMIRTLRISLSVLVHFCFTKTKDIQMFRLAESSNAILVHEELRDALQEKGFDTDITFYDLKEAAI